VIIGEPNPSEGDEGDGVAVGEPSGPVPSPTLDLSKLGSEELAQLKASQCTDSLRQFWKAVQQPGEQPALYLWTILESNAYFQSLKELCGKDYVNSSG
jgi:hypothetical protein